MTSIGLLSDTHGYLPKEVFHHFADVDCILHAGDVGNIELLDELKEFKPTHCVYGNIDGAEIRIVAPEFLSIEIESCKILMMHIGGYPPKYNLISKELIAIHKPHVFICGHSHILKVMPDALNNLLHINPGACGKHGWHKVKTLVKFTVDGASVKNLQVIELP
jgi:uncharacterized protein